MYFGPQFEGIYNGEAWHRQVHGDRSVWLRLFIFSYLSGEKREVRKLALPSFLLITPFFHLNHQIMTQDSASYIQGRSYFSGNPLWNAITEKQRDVTQCSMMILIGLSWQRKKNDGIKLLLFNIFENFYNKMSTNRV